MRKILLLVGLSLFFLPSNLLRAEQGLHVAPIAGYLFHTDDDTDNSFYYGGEVGYEFSNNFEVGLSLEYSKFGARSINAERDIEWEYEFSYIEGPWIVTESGTILATDTYTADTEITSIPLKLYGRYNFKLNNPKIRPFIGAFVGYSFNDIDKEDEGWLYSYDLDLQPGAVTVLYDNTQWIKKELSIDDSWLVGVEVGFGIELNERITLALGASYTYGTLDIDTKTTINDEFGSPHRDEKIESALSNIGINGALRITF